MHRFEFLSPANLTEAVSLLNHYAATARVISGGTDLLTAFKEGWDRPEWVINLAGLGELRHIEFDPDRGLIIGAGTTVREVETSLLVRQNYPVIANAAATLASIQIRNMATVAGNICRASPSADMPPSLLVLDASVRAIGPHGERVIHLADFFKGPGKTILATNEILMEILIPPVLPNSGAVYIKHSPRQAMDLAAIGIAVAITLDSGFCKKVRIAMGAVAPTPRRVFDAENLLTGQKPSPDLFEQAADLAVAACQPIGDIRASANYRQKMVRVLVVRALIQAAAFAQDTIL